MNCQLYKAVENNSSNNSNIFSRICNWTVTPKCMLSPWVWTFNLRITTKKTVIIHYIGICRTHFAWKKEPHKCLLLNLKQLESIFQPHNPRWILESWRPLQIAKGLLEGTKFRSSLGTCPRSPSTCSAWMAVSPDAALPKNVTFFVFWFVSCCREWKV